MARRPTSCPVTELLARGETRGVLYFKLFGRFIWEGGQEFAGCFEIFAQPEPEYPAALCVRWLPVEGEAPPVSTTPLADLTAAALEAVKNGKAFCVSLGKASPHRLVIPGAAIIEHYGYANDGKQELSLRWILASSFTQGKTVCHSAIILGDAPAEGLGHGLGFQLAIPTPAPHGVIDKISSNAFPFRVHYQGARPAADEQKLPARGVAAGAEGAASQCQWLDLTTLDSEWFPSHILGEFGFCPFNGGKEYLHFPRAADSNRAKLRAALWPTDADRYAKETLGLFAARSTDLVNKLQLSALFDLPQAYQSIGFGRRDTLGRTFFRSAFKAVRNPAGVPGGDLRIIDGIIKPLDPFGVGDCLENSQAEGWTFLDLITEYRIDQDELQAVARGEREATGFAAIRLSVEHKVGAANGQGSWQPRRGEFQQFEGRADRDGNPIFNNVGVHKLIELGLRSTRMPRLGLDIVAPLEPANGLPDMGLASAGQQRFALAADLPFRLTQRQAPETDPVQMVDEIRCNVSPVKRKRWPLVELGLRRWDYDADRALESDPGPLRISFTLPGIDIAGQADKSLFRAALLTDRDIGDPERVGVISLHLGVDPKAMPGEAFVGRLGGLELASTQARLALAGPARNAGHWRFRPERVSETGGGGADLLAGPNDFLLNLALDAIEPIGVDIAWGDRTGRPRPLLLRDGERGSAPARYILSLRDQVARDDDRRLTAEILDGTAVAELQGEAADEPPPGPAAARYILLSEQPFSIMRFEAQSLDARGDAGNLVVASFDSDTRQWSLRMTSKRYRYSLPPQGIGESMDKPRRLALLDPEDGTTASTPQAAGECVNDGYLKRHAIDYRLTSPADLWIEPSDLDRNFYLPEWASYEIFRQRGDLGTGAALAGLRAEFLYGLGVSVNPALEKGAAATARVAEIEALLGRPVRKGEQTADNRGWVQKWNRLADAIAHRPERLELWMREAGAAQPFAPARFDRGVRFALRKNAAFRSPFPTPFDDAELHPRLSRHGLPGGVLWPIESRAFCREFLDRPDSTGGTIDRIALAPHGGDADFRAEFLNGLLAVIAEVRAGRVQRQRVEIIGRIGAFWNRAKHVVIYERTVSPSPQFTPDEGIGATSRRPVLRKVEEFVELLEPERFYPDGPGGSEAMAGFLHAVRFNSRRIHVDSAWSEDVGASGWQIPLWNRRSAQRRPSVYPQPDIAFVTHAEGDEDRPLVAQQCLDPENLYFYSDSKAPDADTDRWAPVISVDWVNLPAPTARQQPDLDGQARDGETKLPSAPRIPRGYRRFTWRLAPASRRTRLNAGRAGQPLYAALDTLTFSRAVAAEPPERAVELSNVLANVSEDVRPDRGIGADLQTLGTAVRNGDRDRILAAADRFKASIDQVDPRLFKLKALDPLRDLATTQKPLCHKLVDDFAAGLERKKLLLTAELRAWLEQADTIQAPQPGDTRDAWIRIFVAEIMGEIAPALGDLQADIGRVETDVANAGAIVSQFETELFSLFDGAKRKLDQTKQAFADGKPWSPARIEGYHKQLEAGRDALIGDLTAAVSEVRSRLSTELGRVSNGITTAVGALLEEIAGGEAAIHRATGDAESAALAVLADIGSAYARQLATVDNALTTAIDLIKAKPGHYEIVSQLEAMGVQFDTASGVLDAKLGKLATDVRAGRLDLSGLIVTAFKDLQALVFPVADQGDAIAAELLPVADALKSEPELRAAVLKTRLAIKTLAAELRGLLDQAASAQVGLLLMVGKAKSAALQLLGELRRGFAAQVNAARERYRTAVAAIAAVPAYEETARKLEAIADAFQKASRPLEDKLLTLETELRAGRLALDGLITAAFAEVGDLTDVLAGEAADIATQLDAIATELATEPDLCGLVELSRTGTIALAGEIDALLEEIGQWAQGPNHLHEALVGQIDRALAAAGRCAGGAFARIDAAQTQISSQFDQLKEKVKPEFVDKVLTRKIVVPAFDAVISEAEFERLRGDLVRARARVTEAVEGIEARLSQIDELAAAELKAWQDEAGKVCDALGAGVTAIHAALDAAAEQALAKLQHYLGLADAIKGAIDDAQELGRLIGAAERDFKQLTGAIDSARVQAEAYVDRVLDVAGNITSGGIAAVPNNLLRLYAAAASAPALPNLDFARERLGYYYDSIRSVIDTTKAEAWFGRLGSELKALGLSLPFERIGEGLIPDDLSKLDISKVFRNFGGIDLSGLFRGYRLPEGAGDAIRVTHAYDPKQARAWVQIDINLAIPGRKALFSMGPFTLDFVNSRLAATVRLEASKESAKVEQTGWAALTTTVDSVVSGQSMVALQEMVVCFEQGGGLKVDLDPKKIKLNPAFKFIQETLGSLFPDEVGGLKLIKQNGVPIGVEHEFSMPPISLMAGTSGVSNIAISNRFALVAFPDFMITNRFALSRPELPFLFTIFVIGGSGYINVDCDYRPFTKELTVTVEAAAGGSAALGFALGPISGSVFVSLSVALAYRKQLGRPGGGLRASIELLIAGRVDVAGLATVNLALLLRMQYHESGRIDGIGTVSVSIRISRFYTYKYRTNANYTLRNGGGGGSSTRAAPAALGFAPSVAPSKKAMNRAARILQARA